MRWLLVAAVLAMIGCGRYAFEPTSDGPRAQDGLVATDAGVPDGPPAIDARICLAQHTLHAGPVLFEAARLDCRSRGHWLVTVEEQAENDAVAVLAAADRVWLGINDVATEGSFVWDGPPSSFTSWISGQPNDGDAGSTEDCGAMDPGGMWRDEDCLTEVYAYVCECE